MWSYLRVGLYQQVGELINAELRPKKIKEFNLQNPKNRNTHSIHVVRDLKKIEIPKLKTRPTYYHQKNLNAYDK